MADLGSTSSLALPRAATLAPAQPPSQSLLGNLLAQAARRPDLAFSVLATLTVLGLMAAYGVRPAVAMDALGQPFQILGAFLAIVAIVRAPALVKRWSPLARRAYARALYQGAIDFAPFVWLYIIYRSLRRMTDVLSIRSVEPLLVRIGERLFGTEPTFWIQQFASPWLTEVMTFAYALMFVYPLIILVLLHVRERRDLFREVALALLAIFFIGFLLYIFVPAQSPRLVYPLAYEPRHLTGVTGFYAFSERTWDAMQMITYDAFPSLHTGVSTLSLLYAGALGPVLWPRRPRALFFIFLPFVVALWLSTLYLRQHYVIDVFAGFAISFAVVWLCRRGLRGRAPGRSLAV